MKKQVLTYIQLSLNVRKGESFPLTGTPYGFS